MEELDDRTYDVIVVGTGLTEAVAAAAEARRAFWPTRPTPEERSWASGDVVL